MPWSDIFAQNKPQDTNHTFLNLTFVADLHYLPSVPWMALAWHTAVLELEAVEHFQKGSYRNRCHIAGPNGIQRLSIPLQQGKHQQTPIREVRIAYREPWRQVHWRSIQAAYGNAPFYDFYAGELEGFYLKKHVFLFDFNLELLQFLLEKTGWSGEIRLTGEYRFKGPDGNLPGYLRDTVTPQKMANLSWFTPLPYPQVFAERHGFLPGLSALDLLFCQGKNAGNILLQSSENLYPA